MDKIMTREEVAQHLQVSTRTIHRWEQQGMLPCIVFSGTLVRYKEKDVEKLVEDFSCKRRR
jgi:excisionase family DNA binding protein